MENKKMTMEKPEIVGLNAIVCIFDQVAAVGILGTAGTMVPTMAVGCNVAAVVAVFGVG